MTENTPRLDHVVLRVRDPVASAEFYDKTLGTAPVRLAEFIAGGGAVPLDARQRGDHPRPMPMAMAERMKMLPGAAQSAGHPVNHVCLSLPEADFHELRTHLEEQDVPVSDYSYDSFGARGKARRSFYFRDPDGNVFEARYYD
ncbi:VOC family protein [Streptomyces sp. NPDC006385]|uniref:VOC family protein n=1 Tax=Streptomyces sp. NPDC006385 TaxID=3156761 RepID=UPI0033B1D786